jgi:four helix bundle protein
MDDGTTSAKTKYSYRNLLLWQRAQEFAVDIVKLVDTLPAKRSTDSIARQIVRSATSIGANIAEGHGRFTPAAHRNYLSIAKGSACETDSWLDLLSRLDLINRETEAHLHRKCEALIAGLTAKINEMERTGRSVREDRADYEIGAVSPGSEVPRF